MILRNFFSTLFVLSTVVRIVMPMDIPTKDDQGPWDPNDCLAGTPTLLHRSLDGHTDYLSAVQSFTLNDQWYAVSGSQDTTVRVWNLKTCECIHVLEGHTNNVTSLCCMSGGLDDDLLIISGGGKVLGGGTDDFSIRVWSFDAGTCLRVLDGHTDSVMGICVIRKNIIASCSADKTVKLWDLEEGICIGTINLEGDYPQSFARLDDQHIVYANYTPGTMNVINIVSGECILTLPVPNPAYQTFVLAISEEQFISWNGQIDVWNWKSGQKERSFVLGECMENWGFETMVPYGPNQVILGKVNGNLWVFDYVTEQKHPLDTGLFGVSCLAVAGPWLVYAPIPLAGNPPILRVSPNQFFGHEGSDEAPPIFTAGGNGQGQSRSGSCGLF